MILVLIILGWPAVCTAAFGDSPPDSQVSFWPSVSGQAEQPAPTAAAPTPASPTPAAPVGPVLPTWTPFPAFTNTPLPPVHTPTSTPTTYPLPVFSTDKLIRVASPAAYLSDTCEYLEKRWDPENSPPGTVVVPLMFHNVLPPGVGISNPNQVTLASFQASLERARALGFETITARELLGFLQDNARIPPRSMLVIVDDLYSQDLEKTILPALAPYGWAVTSGFISASVPEAEWTRMETLVASGVVDPQAHGFSHHWETYIYPDTPETLVRQEIINPLPVFQAHFGQQPVAFIWPGGHYTAEAVEIAHQAGYQLGFTIRNRGPILFNWVPQGDEEKAVAHPLLVLPRVWSRDMMEGLDQAVKISQEATVYARVHRQEELAWLDMYCQ
jgi:peptidoglycan/xylan/chitin deacetylase (PgdA/CDA1 family)